MLKMKSFLTGLFVLLSYIGMSQSPELANSYFRKGDYEKAIVLYEPLYENNPIRQDYFKSLLTCYQQIESYDKSQVLIEEQLLRFPQQVYLQVELG